MRFVVMYSLPGDPPGAWEHEFQKGRIPFVIFAIIPDSCAISISPIHNAMTPAMVMQGSRPLWHCLTRLPSVRSSARYRHHRSRLTGSFLPRYS